MTLLSSLRAASTKATTPPRSRDITRDVLNGGQIKILNGNAVIYGTETAGLIKNSYLLNGDLYSIVNYLLEKALRCRYFLYEIKDEKALTDYRLLKSEGATVESIRKGAGIRKKALEETSHPEIDRLLTSPNPDQKFKALSENAIAYKLLTGERFLQIVPGLYPVTRLYVLPPTQMEVRAGERYMQIGGYTYQASQTDFEPEEIQFSRKFYPAINGYGDELRGLSPLRVLALQIQKSNEGTLSGLRQYQNSGPPGILSLTDDEAPLTPEQAKQYEDVIARKSGSRNRGRVNVTGMHAEWVEMGLSPIDLDILKSGLFDLQGMCRAYKIDSRVLGDPSSSTYANMAEARKAAIVDAVIPIVEDYGDDLNAVIEPFSIKGKRYFIDSDVSHFPELAEDLNAIAERMSRPGFTPNEFREAMQYERIDGPLMDEPWFGNDKTPLSQFAAPTDQQPGNDGTY